jgi:hypothetical protein
MKTILTTTALSLVSAGVLLLFGCGGGGGGGSASGTTTILSGTAAIGAAFSDAVITVVDSRGQTVGTSSAVGSNGTYSITLASGAVAPFILTASRTSADGSVESLVSVVPSTTGSAAVVNITPVTNLIASRLSSSGNPLTLATEMVAGTTVVNATTLTAKVTEVQTILGPVLAATGTAGTAPITGTFAVDGTGYDRLLDSIKVTITPASATTASIEVGIKETQAAVSTPPTTIQFSNTDPIATITTNNAISTTGVGGSIGGNAITNGNLVVSGTSALIAAHITQLNTCFALPLASRVNSALSGTAPNRLSVGSAADVLDSACRTAFFGNDPANFKSNGGLVGRNISDRGAFSGLFKEGANNVIFSQGTYEFTRANGDIVVGYKSKTAAGNETFDTFVLRLDTDGKLKQIGNQYTYPGGVSAYHQKREFITLSQTAWNYYSTGYNVSVDDVTSIGGVAGTGIGNSYFDRVVVTSPKGNTLTLKPKVGYSYLTLVTDGTNSLSPSTPNGSGTSFVRLNSEYVDTANAADPKAKDTAALFFADRSVFTNVNIATLQAQSIWKFEYYLATATGTVAQTQYYKTRARALTIPELKTKGLATLTAAAITAVQTGANGSGVAFPGQLPFGGEVSATLTYTVPTGALPPTSLTVWGVYTGGSFTDSLALGSTARTGNIPCTSTGGGDTHCTAGAFSASVKINSSHLWARDPQGRDYASFYAMYSL